MSQIPYSAFTAEHNTKVREILSPIAVGRAGISNKMNAIQCIALWDTGATSSVISEKIIKDLNLIPHDKGRSMTANGWADTNVYYVNIFLPNNVEVQSIRVTNVDFTDDPDNKIDVIIGMDIITLGDFAVTNFNGKTTMSFLIPSYEKINFIDIAHNENIQMSGN